MISYDLPNGQAQPGVFGEDSEEEVAEICTASYAVRVVGTPTSIVRSDLTSSPGATSSSKVRLKCVIIPQDP